MEKSALKSSVKENERSTTVHGDSASASSTIKTDPELNKISTNVSEDSSKLEDINNALARAIFSSDAPLSLLDSQCWKEAFLLLNENYTVPSHHMLTTELLDKEYERVKEIDRQKLHNALALGLVIDDSTNILGEGVVNIMITTPEPMYYKAVYPEPQTDMDKFLSQDNKVNEKYLSQQVAEVITEIGEEKFGVVITDSPLNLELVTKLFPHMRRVGCASYYLNLIRSDILKLSVLSDFISGLTSLMKFLRNKTTMERRTWKLSKTERNDIAMLMVFFQNRDLVDFFTQYRGQNRSKRTEAVESIREDPAWIVMNEHLGILNPIAEAIVKSELDKCILSDVPILFDNLKTDIATGIQSVTWLDQANKDYVLQSISKRRALCLQPIHYAANMLDPRYRGTDLTGDEFLCGSDFIIEQAKYLKLDATSVIKNLCRFKIKAGFFGKSDAIWIAVNEVEPRIWWEAFAHGQVLRPIATIILSMPASSAPSKRKMSEIGNIPAVSKRQLDKKQLLKLISVRSNLHCHNTSSDDDDEETDSIQSNSEDASENEVIQED